MKPDGGNDLLDAAEALVSASRQSAAAVLETLAGVVRKCEPAIDALLIFRRELTELRCLFAQGARAEGFEGAAIAGDAQTMPGRAQLCGHHVLMDRNTRPVIPSDRAAIAVPFADGSAIVYASSMAVARFVRAGTLARAITFASVPYAIALEREADRAQATYDGLTGLYTARAFRDMLQRDFHAAALGMSARLALWFIDTDGFKSINDTHGHAAGDLVLQRLASILREHLRGEGDIGARNGGDEFCAILRKTQKVRAIERAQEFCEAVRASAFGVASPVTVSVGVAACPYDARAANELLEIADAAMYHSKRSGRDRVAFSHEGAFTVYH